MADYGKLLSRIWSDPDFTAIDTHAQQMYCLLISYPTRSYAGVVPLTLKRWANASRDATIENVTEALQVLEDARFVVIDWDTEELLIRTYVRNDALYKQSNLMKSALKSGVQIASPTLRWALYDEVSALPPPNDGKDLSDLSNALVDGLERTPRAPRAHPARTPRAAPGVGEGYVLEGNTYTDTEHRTPAPAAAPHAPTSEPLGAVSATPGADIVRTVIPPEHPPAIQTGLRLKSSELLKSGTPTETVAEALRLWLAKPWLSPNALPNLVSEAIRSRDRPSQQSTSDQRAANVQALKTQTTGLELEA